MECVYLNVRWEQGGAGAVSVAVCDCDPTPMHRHGEAHQLSVQVGRSWRERESVHYSFIVDGVARYDPSKPTLTVAPGRVVNVAEPGDFDRLPLPAVEVMAAELWDELSMAPNIRNHCRAVHRVAMAVVGALSPAALSAAQPRHKPYTFEALVSASAFLHDITKTRSLTTKEHHDHTAGAEMRARGLRAVARVVEQHVDLRHFDPNDRLRAAEVVCYADKRVKHDAVVSLEERLQDLVVRYCRNAEDNAAMQRRFDQYRGIEEKLIHCTTAGVLPC
eukprot:TRINITY_DN18905_c0_g1_i1.p1 TRINITY_DN18905_c0_g1~~TRINITY_DN18905_c0_g1_i1.p1  ORF type:complete len:288 (-),score=69.76 TRINITY_DN18905_c0_g1_i1:95-922(-)